MAERGALQTSGLPRPSRSAASSHDPQPRLPQTRLKLPAGGATPSPDIAGKRRGADTAAGRWEPGPARSRRTAARQRRYERAVKRRGAPHVGGRRWRRHGEAAGRAGAAAQPDQAAEEAPAGVRGGAPVLRQVSVAAGGSPEPLGRPCLPRGNRGTAAAPGLQARSLACTRGALSRSARGPPSGEGELRLPPPSLKSRGNRGKQKIRAQICL